MFAFEKLTSICIGRITWRNVDINDFKIFNLARFFLAYEPIVGSMSMT
jgi:hypothetical protein